MNSLQRIVALKPIEVPQFQLDSFQEAVLENLHLEFFLRVCRVLIAPDLTYMTTGEMDDDETWVLDGILRTRADTIYKWRRYILVNLALYSGLLESNSYFLSLADNIPICRFVSIQHAPDQYVVKLYSIAGTDLPDNYSDKIYLGRDRISMRSLRREHFGLEGVRTCVSEQLAKLQRRMFRLVPRDETELYQREFLADMEEATSELSRMVDSLLVTIPHQVLSHSPEISRLLAANAGFREIKHLLTEMDSTLLEMERLLMQEKHIKGARYVTKFRKDISNTIIYIMCKVNGRISNIVNRVDALAFFQTAAGVGA